MKNKPILNSLQKSFATVIASIIMSDTKISKKERVKFNNFFVDSFSLNQEEIHLLFEESINDIDNLDKHLEELKKGLTKYPKEKIAFMRYLNECIICDGVDNREYITFEKIKSSLF
jgi:uncharacterized tellurite resistance protein B-like protein